MQKRRLYNPFEEMTLAAHSSVTSRRALLGLRGAMMCGSKKGKYEGINAFKVSLTDPEDLTFSFPFWNSSWPTFKMANGKSAFRIDWGDGSTEDFTYTSSLQPSHTYDSIGERVITISDDIEYFWAGKNTHIIEALGWGNNILYANIPNNYSGDMYNFGTYCKCQNLVKICDWGKNVTTARGCYRETAITEAAPWNERMTDAECAYQKTKVTNIPEWNNIKNANSCFDGCTYLDGVIPDWGVVETAMYTFQRCTNLKCSVPRWNNEMKQAYETFGFCKGLTGTIPKWGNNITNATFCFYGCSGLSGIWDDSATDDEIMPDHITSHNQVVTQCSSAVRSKFLTSWGGSRS